MKLRLLAACILLLPWGIIALEFTIIFWADARGCEISARGAQPCMLLGSDIGEWLYPLWSVGYQIVFACIWFFPGLILWAFAEAVVEYNNIKGRRR